MAINMMLGWASRTVVLTCAYPAIEYCYQLLLEESEPTDQAETAAIAQRRETAPQRCLDTYKDKILDFIEQGALSPLHQLFNLDPLHQKIWHKLADTWIASEYQLTYAKIDSFLDTNKERLLTISRGLCKEETRTITTEDLDQITTNVRSEIQNHMLHHLQGAIKPVFVFALVKGLYFTYSLFYPRSAPPASPLQTIYHHASLLAEKAYITLNLVYSLFLAREYYALDSAVDSTLHHLLRTKRSRNVKEVHLNELLGELSSLVLEVRKNSFLAKTICWKKSAENDPFAKFAQYFENHKRATATAWGQEQMVVFKPFTEKAAVRVGAVVSSLLHRAQTWRQQYWATRGK